MNNIKKSTWYKSSHKFYLIIAIKHLTPPTHVYKLAHGAYVYYKDRSIMHDLIRYKVLTRG